MTDKKVTGYDIGYLGEIIVAGELLSRGIPTRFGGPADLLIHGDDETGIPVEVKTSRSHRYRIDSPRPGYSFRFRRRQDRDPGEFFICLCLDNNLPVNPNVFIIPRHALNGNKIITIPSDPQSYAGKWSPWLNQWDLLKL